MAAIALRGAFAQGGRPALVAELKHQRIEPTEEAIQAILEEIRASQQALLDRTPAEYRAATLRELKARSPHVHALVTRTR